MSHLTLPLARPNNTFENKVFHRVERPHSKVQLRGTAITNREVLLEKVLTKSTSANCNKLSCLVAEKQIWVERALRSLQIAKSDLKITCSNIIPELCV